MGTPEHFRVAYIGEMEKVYKKKKMFSHTPKWLTSKKHLKMGGSQSGVYENFFLFFSFL